MINLPPRFGSFEEYAEFLLDKRRDHILNLRAERSKRRELEAVVEEQVSRISRFKRVRNLQDELLGSIGEGLDNYNIERLLDDMNNIFRAISDVTGAQKGYAMVVYKGPKEKFSKPVAPLPWEFNDYILRALESETERRLRQSPGSDPTKIRAEVAAEGPIIYSDLTEAILANITEGEGARNYLSLGGGELYPIRDTSGVTRRVFQTGKALRVADEPDLWEKYEREGVLKACSMEVELGELPKLAKTYSQEQIEEWRQAILEKWEGRESMTAEEQRRFWYKIKIPFLPGDPQLPFAQYIEQENYPINRQFRGNNQTIGQIALQMFDGAHDMEETQELINLFSLPLTVAVEAQKAVATERDLAVAQKTAASFRFASALQHEVNTHLSTIGTYVHQMERNLETGMTDLAEAESKIKRWSISGARARLRASAAESRAYESTEFWSRIAEHANEIDERVLDSLREKALDDYVSEHLEDGGTIWKEYQRLKEHVEAAELGPSLRPAEFIKYKAKFSDIPLKATELQYLGRRFGPESEELESLIGLLREVEEPAAVVRALRTSSEMREAVTSIRSARDNVQNLVDSLRGQLRGVLEKDQQLDTLVRSAYTATRQANPGTCVELDADVGDLRLECIPTQISQIYHNLFNNSVYAGADSIEVRAWIEEEGGRSYIVSSVTDNGPGVPEEHREKVFEHLFTTKPQGEGTGIGLSMSIEYAINHQGTIRLDKEYSDGARFLVRIPVNQPEAPIHSS